MRGDIVRDPALVGTALLGAGVGLIRCDAAGGVRSVTEPWSAVMQLSPELALGDGWLDAVRPRERREAAAAWAAGIASGEPFAVRMRVRRSDGAVAWAEFRMTPVASADALAGWTGAFADVTGMVRDGIEAAARERIATAVAERRDPREIFDLVAREAVAIAGCEAGGVVRLDGGVGVLVGTWAHEGMPTAPLGTVASLGAPTATARAIREGRPAHVRHPATVATGPAFLRDNPYRAAAAAPIRVRGEMWGALAVATGWESRLPPDVEDQLERFARLLSLAVADADVRLGRRLLAEADLLTGLPNARAFQERLMAQTAAWAPGGRDMSVVILDVDGFAQLNEAHGHQAGDRVLAEVARRLHDVVRMGEFVARLGGGEFAWIAAAGAEATRAAAERLRARVSRDPIPPAGRVTLSCGIAEMNRDIDAAELFRRAERALRAAGSDGGAPGPLPANLSELLLRDTGREVHALRGRVAATATVGLGDELVQVWSVSPHAELVVDLSQVTWMDDAAGTALLAAAHEIASAGGRLSVREPSPEAAAALRGASEEGDPPHES